MNSIADCVDGLITTAHDSDSAIRMDTKTMEECGCVGYTFHYQDVKNRLPAAAMKWPIGRLAIDLNASQPTLAISRGALAAIHR